MIQFELVLPIHEDAELIRTWRNDPVTLANSFTYRTSKSLETFFPEFLKTYYSYPSLPPLFAVLQGVRIGALRFDPAASSTDCEISLLIAPTWRNRGLGAQVLKAIDPFLKRERIGKVIARIRPENIASIKTFMKTGYKLIEEREFLRFEKVLDDKTKEPVYIIAEIGSNWHIPGDKDPLKTVYELIDLAKEAACNAVKFQMFRARTVYVSNPGHSGYLKANGVDQDIRSLFEELEMPKEIAIKAAKYSEKVGIDFLASVFSEEDFDFIDPLVRRHKIASYEISHVDLIAKAARSGKPLIMSVGASNEADIDFAVETFQKNGGKELTLLQCTAKYPASPDAMQLQVIPWLISRYGVCAGLSDHSQDPLCAPLAAVALGASLVEKHFTKSRGLIGPDHAFAIEPLELKQMVSGIRSVEKMLGSPLKFVQEEEKELYYFARRGIQALRDIRQGEILQKGVNIAVLRPGERLLGMHPKHLREIEGKLLNRAVSEGEGIQMEDIL